MPASVSASSYASDWALMRYSTAISAAGVPDSTSFLIDRATAAASATSSGYSWNVGDGPGSRWPIRCSLLPATRPRAAAITRLASDTTCGVER